jgi:hypothetical protein
MTRVLTLSDPLYCFAADSAPGEVLPSTIRSGHRPVPLNGVFECCHVDTKDNPNGVWVKVWNVYHTTIDQLTDIMAQDIGYEDLADLYGDLGVSKDEPVTVLGLERAAALPLTHTTGQEPTPPSMRALEGEVHPADRMP